MANKEQTSKPIASLAGKGLKNPKKLTKKNLQSLAGSALTQAPNKGRKKKAKPKGR